MVNQGPVFAVWGDKMLIMTSKDFDRGYQLHAACKCDPRHGRALTSDVAKRVPLERVTYCPGIGNAAPDYRGLLAATKRKGVDTRAKR